jgi:hypothetical protein
MSEDIPLYMIVPKWIVKCLKRRNCSECGTQIHRENLISIGIRKQKDRTTEAIVEHICPECQVKGITSIIDERNYPTIEHLCYILIEEIQKIKRCRKTNEFRKKQNKNKSAFTKEEADRMIKFVKRSKNHDEFMRHIGAQSKSKKKK